MAFSKVSFKRLEVFTPPLSVPIVNGGRIMTLAGELAQVVNNQVFRYLAYIEFSENTEASRGNHYHTTKEEFLYVLKGRLRAIYKDVDTDETQEFFWGAGDLVNIKPRCAHIYFPLEYSQAIEFSDSNYDPSDTHTYQMMDATRDHNI
jgi:dTDP-4-dehydrorhamnose 3,5-epimerase-like enzyme